MSPRQRGRTILKIALSARANHQQLPRGISLTSTAVHHVGQDLQKETSGGKIITSQDHARWRMARFRRRCSALTARIPIREGAKSYPADKRGRLKLRTSAIRLGEVSKEHATHQVGHEREKEALPTITRTPDEYFRGTREGRAADASPNISR